MPVLAQRRRGGPAQTAGAVLAEARLLHGWRERRDREREEARQSAWDERAGIIAEGCKVDRATAERWATACIERVPGAV